MKKALLLILSALLLAGCDYGERYRPTHGGNYVRPPEAEKEEGGGEEEEDELQCTYNFYLSYSHTTYYNKFSGKDEDAPIYTMKHAMLKPVEAVPEEIKTAEQIKALAKTKYGFEIDPTFPNFIGYSYNGLCLDESGLWNWGVDYKQQAVINLYAVWVSE